jgi:hypothetical protein
MGDRRYDGEKLVASLDTPLPEKIARRAARMAAGDHKCLHEDAAVLFDDLRTTRKRRWAIIMAVSVFALGSLSGLTIWIYGIGERVGSAQTEMRYMQRASEADRQNIGKNTDAVRTMERENATRYSEIQNTLTRLDARLENIEKALSKRR